jgi:hypothetical protein
MMKPINAIFLLVLALTVIFFSNGCTSSDDGPVAEGQDDVLTTAGKKTKAEVRTEIEEMVCNAAEKGGTCDYKLASFGLISKKDCCSKYGVCC